MCLSYLLQGCLICLFFAAGFAFASSTRYVVLVADQYPHLHSFVLPHRIRSFGSASTFCCRSRNCEQALSSDSVVFAVRARELRNLRNKEREGHSLSFLCPELDELEHSAQTNLPRVGVVMPVKGVGEHSLSNWYSQVLVNQLLYCLARLFTSMVVSRCSTVGSL